MARYGVTFVLAILTLHQQLNSIFAEEEFYPGVAVSERDLQPCGKHEVCSIVHQRFFYSKIVERFCRCEGKECPSSWVDSADNYTMYANNRAQMKFCEPVTDLPNCLDNNETTPLYLTITNTTRHVRMDIEPAQTTTEYRITSKASCHCPQHHRWTCSSLKTNSSAEAIVMEYRCAALDKCKTGNFCGSERSDFYSVYYHCSCPKGDYCVRNENSEFLAREIFYDGPAHRTFCTKFPDLRNNH